MAPLPPPLSFPLATTLPFLFTLLLAGARWLPTLMLVPLFAPRALPVAIRAALSMALALPAAGFAVSDGGRVPPALGEALGLAAKELGIGFAIAIALSIPFWAIAAAGAWIDYQRGANPQALDPTASIEGSVFGAVLELASSVYLIRAGAFHAVLAIVHTSFAHWPADTWMPPITAETGRVVTELLGGLASYALILAFPPLLALVFVEAIFAVLARTSVRLPAYVAALPFKCVAALFAVALVLPDLLQSFCDLTVGQIARTATLFGIAPAQDPQ